MRRLLAVAVVVVSAGCSDPVGGALEIGLQDGKTRSFAPNDCASGEPLEFFGVDMWDQKDRTLRFVDFPLDGPALLYFDPHADNETFRLYPGDCQRFDGELKRTDKEHNGVWEMRGSIDLDCTAATGETAVGHLDFDGCADRNNNYDD